MREQLARIYQARETLKFIAEQHYRLYRSLGERVRALEDAHDGDDRGGRDPAV